MSDKAKYTGNPRFRGNPSEDIGVHDDIAVMGKFGKKAAGRTLDGRTWDEVPSP